MVWECVSRWIKEIKVWLILTVKKKTLPREIWRKIKYLLKCYMQYDYQSLFKIIFTGILIVNCLPTNSHIATCLKWAFRIHPFVLKTGFLPRICIGTLTWQLWNIDFINHILRKLCHSFVEMSPDVIWFFGRVFDILAQNLNKQLYLHYRTRHNQSPIPLAE